MSPPPNMEEAKGLPSHGAVLVGAALLSALRSLPQPANDRLRPIADELERRA